MVWFVTLAGIAVVIWHFVNKSNKEKMHQQAQEAIRRRNEELMRMCIQRSLNVISESLEIARNSTNPATKKSRIGVAIKTAEDMKDSYPDFSDYTELLDSLLKERIDIHTNCIVQAVIKNTDKANASKTSATRINYASKALAVIEEGLRDEYTDKDNMRRIQDQLENFIHQVQLQDLKNKAEKLEFKGNHSKAADAYLDVLYFLRKDHIDDNLQADEINALQEKIQLMQGLIQKTPKKHTRKKLTDDSVSTDDGDVVITLASESGKKQ